MSIALTYMQKINSRKSPTQNDLFERASRQKNTWTCRERRRHERKKFRHYIVQKQKKTSKNAQKRLKNNPSRTVLEEGYQQKVTPPLLPRTNLGRVTTKSYPPPPFTTLPRDFREGYPKKLPSLTK